MAVSLQTRQIQRQVATPAQMMEMSLLTLPINELRTAIQKEVETNPALERIDRPLGGARGSSRSAGETDWLENVADERGETLEDHLLGELRMSGVAGRELELCQAIVAELDDDGRFKGEVPSLCMVTGATAEEIEAARQRIMMIEPKGCGALDLAECFRAQISLVPSNKREAVLADLAHLTSGKVAPETIAFLRKMNPFPGRLYDHRKTEFVVPDVRVDERGRFVIDQSDIPLLRISPKYAVMARDRTLDAETRHYAQERVRHAQEFQQALIRRQETMEKIVDYVLSHQQAFLTEGPSALKKLTMSEVAQAVSCAISTVSRAAARKYVRTPRGTIPFRRFFAVIDQAPVEKLRELLKAIPPGQHVSDQRLSEQMARAGYPMARRTVAKYRAKMI